MKFLLTVFLALQFSEVFAMKDRCVLATFEGREVSLFSQEAGPRRTLDEFVGNCVFFGLNMPDATAKFRPLLEEMFRLPQGRGLIESMPMQTGKIFFWDVSAQTVTITEGRILENLGGHIGSRENLEASRRELKTRMPGGGEIAIKQGRVKAADAVYRIYDKGAYYLTFNFDEELVLVVTKVEQLAEPSPCLTVSFKFVEKDLVERLFHELKHISDEGVPAMDIKHVDVYVATIEKEDGVCLSERITLRYMRKFFPAEELASFEDLFENDIEFVCMTGFFANGGQLFWTPVCEWEVQQTRNGYFRAMHNEIDHLTLHLKRIESLGDRIFEKTASGFSISFLPDCDDGLIKHLRPLTKLWQLFLTCHERYHQVDPV